MFDASKLLDVECIGQQNELKSTQISGQISRDRNSPDDQAVLGRIVL